MLEPDDFLPMRSEPEVGKGSSRSSVQGPYCCPRYPGKCPSGVLGSVFSSGSVLGLVGISNSWEQ